jgi:hypothetical protein
MKQKRFLLAVYTLCAWCFWGTYSSSEEPCTSGLKAGQRWGPYAALISTGPQRGQSFCYVCETGDKPAVVVFARTLSDPLGKLVAQIDQAMADHKKAGLHAWVTFLSDQQLELDPKVVKWSERFAIRGVPLGIFEKDPLGPPSFRLSQDADVTVLMVVKQKVVANFAYRPGELNDDKVKEIMSALPRILSEKK